jgi:predicted negative regulator of RcsB-dependent stress response
MIVRYDIHQNHYDKAKTQLEWVMKHASTSSLKEVARLRYARILNQENHPADALKLLKKINDKDYLPMAEELRGDSYMLLKQEDNARTAYRQAVEGAPYYAAMRPILMMKLDNLAPGSTEQ